MNELAPNAGLEVLHERLAELLGTLNGRLILSLNDKPEIRRIFRDFEIEAIETSYQVQGMGRRHQAREVITSRRL